MQRSTRLSCVSAILSALVLGAASSALASGITAGTLIENTAQATYQTAGGPQTIDSNTVTVMVDELLSVTVASRDAGPIATTPGSEVLTFEIANTGNGPEAFRLTANPSVAGNDFDAVIDGVAVDTNANGVYDAGIDQILTAPATTAPLAADSALTIFVFVTVPAGVADAATSEVELIAQAASGTGAPGTTIAGAGEGGSNAVVGTGGARAAANGRMIVGIAAVALTKSAVVADPFGGTSAVPGAVITYTINAAVSGSGTVSDLVVSDEIPAGTSYVAGSLTLDGAGLSDVAGDDAGEITAAGISVGLGSVAGGTTRAITFNVLIEE